jgi:predicted methyltransferase
VQLFVQHDAHVQCLQGDQMSRAPDGGIPSILEFTHGLVRQVVRSADTVVDATAGNGHDTLFLAGLVGPQGRVYGFDVQAQALENTARRLQRHGAERQVTLFHAGHEAAGRLLPAGTENLACAMFNLGYLPGSDKQVVTTWHTTEAALRAVMPLLRAGGLVTLHLYTGHAGGSAEAAAVHDFCAALPWDGWRVLRYDFLNKEKNRETLLALCRQ